MQTSQALERFLDEAPCDRISIRWIATELEGRSFGFLMLILALAGLAPGVASASGLLLAIPSLQMVAGRKTVVLPEFLSQRSASTESLAKWLRHAIPILAAIERIVPECPYGTPLRATRLIGVVDLMLAIAIAIPVPFAYIPPTLAVIAVSFAQIEDNAFLLAIAFVIAAAAIFSVALISWKTLSFLHHLVGI